jgi:murein L,D-transpeptidase YafK
MSFNKIITIIAVAIVALSFTITTDFLSEQKKHPLVKGAYIDKSELLQKKLKEFNLNLDNINILIATYKVEREMDIYVRKKGETKYKKLATYDICSVSGEPGPKRRYGDSQTPEGFYYVNRYNPTSSYYLSLGLNYPNQSDKIIGKSGNLGGDIFIHGECVTIGCMPMTNDKIKEIYIYAIQAHSNGQSNIPVYIFPFRFTEKNYMLYKEQYKSNTDLLAFWSDLKTGYDTFQKTSEELKVSVDKKGKYVIQ